MNEYLKTSQVCDLLNLKQPGLYAWQEEFQLKIISEMQGQKKVTFYPPETIEILKQIIKWKKQKFSNYDIKNKLGITQQVIDIEVVQDSNLNQSQINHDSTEISIYEHQQDSMKNFVEKYFTRVDKLIHFTNDSQRLSKELGQWQTKAEEKEEFINYLKLNHDRDIDQFKLNHDFIMNQLKINYDSIINELKLNHDRNIIDIKYNHDSIMNNIKDSHSKENELLRDKINTLELEIKNKNIEIERLKDLPWYKRII